MRPRAWAPFLAVASSQSPLLLLLAADLTLLALAGASVGVRALTADGEALAVTEATVAADLHQAGNVLTLLTTEVALDREVSINVITHLGDLILGEIAHVGAGINAGLGADLGSGGTANAVDVGKSDLNALLTREVDAVNTGLLVLLS